MAISFFVEVNMSTFQLQRRSVYNISLRAPSVLGSGYRGATITTIEMDYEDAIRHQQNLTDIHKQALPQLPTGTPSNARDLTYMKIRTTSGESVIIAHEWIGSQPELVENRTIRVLVNDATTKDMQVIRDCLVARGFTNITLDFQ
jgi:hypothetical protein